jgi:hypothetical protein
VQRFILVAVNDTLHNAAAVAQVNKHLVALVTHHIRPAAHRHFLSDRLLVQTAAMMSPFHVCSSNGFKLSEVGKLKKSSLRQFTTRERGSPARPLRLGAVEY